MTLDCEAWRQIRTADVDLWPAKVRERLAGVADTLGDLAGMTAAQLQAKQGISAQTVKAAVEAIRRAIAGEKITSEAHLTIEQMARKEAA